MNRNNKPARTLSRAGVPVALALLAVGCSPPELPLVAVGRGPGGDIQALLRPCSDDAPIQQVEILRIDEKGDAADPAALGDWSARPSETATGEQKISLLSLPENWHGPSGSATKLAPGRTYSLWFVVGPNRTVRYKGIIHFTRADVESLSPGQWWADGKAMSTAAFRAQADDAC